MEDGALAPNNIRSSGGSAVHWGAFSPEVRDGRVVGVRPFAKDRDPSPILESIPDAIYDESRIDRPYVRAGFLDRGNVDAAQARGADPFVPVDWDTALDLVAGEVARVRETWGNEAIFGGSYGWASAGRLHHARTLLHRFLNGAGGFTGQVTNYSYAAGMTIMPHVVGTMQPVSGPGTSWQSIAESTRLMVMFGGVPLKNTQVESGGAGEHTAAQWLGRAREAGVRFVSISPLRGDVAGFLDAEWLAPRPGSDTAIMLGLAHTLVEEGLHDRAFLARYTKGFERFRPYLLGETDGQPKDADWAAQMSGLSAEAIRDLARRMAANRTFITASWSLQRADHGEQTYWMTVVLAALLGQIGLPGGGFGFGYGAVNGMGNPRRNAPVPRMPAGLKPAGIDIPVARITDMLLRPGETIDFNGQRLTYPEIRLIYWAGGNPFHHHQDINRLIEAWRRPETIVVHEPWWTATARHADIVLPATTPLERNDIAASSLDRFVIAMHRAIDPVGEARDDFRIFADLARRLGFGDEFAEGRDEMGWLRHIYDVARQQAAHYDLEMPDFDAFWAAGHIEFAAPDQPYVLFERFRSDPQGAPLRTASGRIEIFSETIDSFGYEDCPAHPVWRAPVEWLGGAKARDYPLHLISNQPATRLHGQMDNGRVSRAQKIRGREPVLIHPQDAAARGVEDRDIVRVFNGRGACLAGAIVTDTIRPGVVAMATGAWYDPVEPGGPGSLDRHGNPNVLTRDAGTSRLAQGPVSGSALVEIERWEGKLPEITIGRPPAITGT
ncbi:MAG: molybdopterin guanine dinucleotide-containing S/N-oxide reductase [Rhodospirillales bacterium]|nr:MAG: molybdopterin guanine dinucleotide-containing S/N-oxide reductase [Rhodospirillales bacterium]